MFLMMEKWIPVSSIGMTPKLNDTFLLENVRTVVRHALIGFLLRVK
ncbi:hypothetical protein JR053_00345 [Wolbachia endosymbiont of Nasonia vitripennis]